MKCPEVRDQMRNFIADMLTEPAHQEIRDHLGSCRTCRNFEMTFSSFKTDLRQLTMQELPFDLGAALYARYHALGESGKAARKVHKTFSAAWTAAGIILGGIIVAALVFGVRTRPPLPEPPGPSPMPEAVRVLENIDQGLRRMVSGEEADQDPGRRVIQVPPLHWDVEFASSSDGEDFRQILAGIKSRTVWQGADFMALEMNFPEMKRMMDAIRTREGIRVRGLPERLGPLQQSEATLTVQVYLSTQGEDERPSEHWHLRFLMGNAFSFLSRLKERKFTVVYETGDLWVLELGNGQYTELHEFMAGFPGLFLEPDSPAYGRKGAGLQTRWVILSNAGGV